MDIIISLKLAKLIKSPFRHDYNLEISDGPVLVFWFNKTDRTAQM